MHPCPCGYLFDSRRACRCSSTKVQNYLGKVSGPLLDRIDIHIELPSTKYGELVNPREAEPSMAIKKRVEEARRIQRERFAAENIFYNSQMNTRQVRRHCSLDKRSEEFLKTAMTELGLSARVFGKILKISRTIADLAGSDIIREEHLAEAVQYRSLDKWR